MEGYVPKQCVVAWLVANMATENLVNKLLRPIKHIPSNPLRGSVAMA
jgi:hypothetical protein